MQVLRPDISPRATAHIIEQIEMVKSLIEKGFAYAANGSVYFDVSRDKSYGKLSGRSVEELEAGARIDVNPEKRHPSDFALWKKAEAGNIMQWPSPWGMGFPGWHVECSAMSIKYLGSPFDIHGGGLENQFPHHECEIAQSECATGREFVRYWIHNNMVTVGGQKMGKSLGNVIRLKDAFAKYSPLVVRFFVLQSHYRSTLDFTNEALEGAAKGLDKLHNTVRNLRQDLQKRNGAGEAVRGIPESLTRFRTSFVEAMDDDFNSPQGIAVLFDLAREVNTLLSTGNADLTHLAAADALFTELGGSILGIIPGQMNGSGTGEKSIEGDLLSLIIDLRAEIRAQKLWPLSDKIRDGLKAAGVTLEDKKEGTTWRRIS
jgi:cysteinyl-tRNA synthetase